MVTELLLNIGLSSGALLPVVNPITTGPIFLSATQGNSPLRRRKQARRAAIYMCCILLVAYSAGEFLLQLFGISLPVLRIAGGLIIVRIAFGMLEPARSPRVSEQEVEEAQEAPDVALVPVAMPMLAGPGSIAVTIAMATQSNGIVADIGVAIGILLVGLCAWLALRFSATISEHIGSAGMNVMTRFMGLILSCIGITFVMTGIVEALTSDALVSVFAEWIETLETD